MKTKISSIILLFLLVVVNFNSLTLESDNASFSLSNLITKVYANGEDNNCGTCPVGYECVNGVCVQLEIAKRTACKVDVICGTWPFQTIHPNQPGHKQTCSPDSKGITNCSGYACIPDTPPC